MISTFDTKKQVFKGATRLDRLENGMKTYRYDAGLLSKKKLSLNFFYMAVEVLEQQLASFGEWLVPIGERLVSTPPATPC